jgi:hypothetical protein
MDFDGSTTESKNPTILFWNRLGMAAIIFSLCMGIGCCTAIANLHQ